MIFLLIPTSLGICYQSSSLCGKNLESRSFELCLWQCIASLVTLCKSVWILLLGLYKHWRETNTIPPLLSIDCEPQLTLRKEGALDYRVLQMYIAVGI